MSAFLCSDRHVYTIVAWGVARGIVTDRIRTAQALRSINNAALKVRYGDQPEKLEARKKGLDTCSDAFEKSFGHSTQQGDQFANALLSCLDYQCSGGDNLETHRARHLLARLRAEAKTRSGGITAPNVWSI